MRKRKNLVNQASSHEQNQFRWHMGSVKMFIIILWGCIWSFLLVVFLAKRTRTILFSFHKDMMKYMLNPRVANPISPVV
ncbi:MAG: hypothetical protein NZ853_10455 [Leptospiraceae bacterium]|nr:hypothetical protein [Leptospiraceae bacterium]MDW7974923.1 hypothetical protein [Leptospiraceae bacterium]